jgi:NADP-dependent 3-hydroxy-3-methylglutaryl-CoA reductase
MITVRGNFVMQEVIESDRNSSIHKETKVKSQLPGRGTHTEAARLERVNFLRSQTGASLKNFETSILDASTLDGNIENYAGTLTIPVGIAGPLLLLSPHGQEEVYAPIATTEGALVASATRGARAISLSGGARTTVIRQKMNRVPMFEFENAFQAADFATWVQSLFPEIQNLIKKYSRHSQLLEIEPKYFGRSVHLRFSYGTKDAAGQNMTTICTWNACKWLLEMAENLPNFGLTHFVLDGGLSADKKTAFSSVINGRGTEVLAEAVIKGDILKQTLKIDVDTLIHRMGLAKSSRLHSGMMGWNINVSNMIAGIFAATGQDIACVHESSLAEFHLEPQISNGQKDLYICLHLPCLIVGTVGGGTRLPVQKEMLEMLNCYGDGKVERLAQIIAGYCLALDLSTGCALAGGQFADAHSRLGRPQSIRYLKKEELNQEFAKAHIPEIKDLEIIEFKEITNVDFSGSLVMDLSRHVTQKACGFFPFEITYRDQNGQSQKIKVLSKIKPTDEEVILASEMMASFCGDTMKKTLERVRTHNLFQKTHLKEIYLGALPELQATGVAPKYLGSIIDEKNQIYCLSQEYLNFIFKPSANDKSPWTPDRIRAAILNIAKVHHTFADQSEGLLLQKWIGYVPSAKSLLALKDLFQELLDFGRKEFSWLTSELATIHQRIIDTVSQWSAEIEILPRTLIHNDFNPRNLSFVEENGQEKFVAFDWELATVGIPQKDSIELLAFLLSPNCTKAEVLDHLLIHRKELERLSGKAISPEDWSRGALLAARELIIHRLSLYFVAHEFKECSFLENTYRTALRIHEILDDLKPGDH